MAGRAGVCIRAAAVFLRFVRGILRNANRHPAAARSCARMEAMVAEAGRERREVRKNIQGLEEEIAAFEATTDELATRRARVSQILDRARAALNQRSQYGPVCAVVCVPCVHGCVPCVCLVVSCWCSVEDGSNASSQFLTSSSLSVFAWRAELLTA